MIEYDFDAGFWNPIAQKTKISTLRNFRIGKRRHARVGEPIELWAAVGGKRLQIRKAQCVSVQGVTLHLAHRQQIRVGEIFKNRSTWAPLGLGARERLAIETGHADWKAAAEAYAVRYGSDPWHGALITWGDREYEGPIPSVPQLRDLRILTQHERVIPSFGKISPAVAHSLLVLKWAEVTDRSMQFLQIDRRGNIPIKITELGRQILDRFEK